MEIRASVRCSFTCVPGFINVNTIRKPGCLTSVFELRPVPRCQESSCRNCAISREMSNCAEWNQPNEEVASIYLRRRPRFRVWCFSHLHLLLFFALLFLARVATFYSRKKSRSDCFTTCP